MMVIGYLMSINRLNWVISPWSKIVSIANRLVLIGENYRNLYKILFVCSWLSTCRVVYYTNSSVIQQISLFKSLLHKWNSTNSLGPRARLRLCHTYIISSVYNISFDFLIVFISPSVFCMLCFKIFPYISEIRLLRHRKCFYFWYQHRKLKN